MPAGAVSVSGWPATAPPLLVIRLVEGTLGPQLPAGTVTVSGCERCPFESFATRLKAKVPATSGVKLKVEALVALAVETALPAGTATSVH